MFSPSGQSLLIDAGFTGFSGRDADRILIAAKDAHVKKIDYVLITHHHADHEGGVPNLLQRFQVGMFYDPGPPVDAETPKQRTFKAYEEAMAKQTREVIKAGATIPVKGLEVIAVAAGGEAIARHGEANPFCEGIEPRVSDQPEQPENARSVAIVATLGKFRFANFGDLTWNKQIVLLQCPENRAGRVDVLESPQHGETNPKAIYALAPRVVVMNNAARGEGPTQYKSLHDSPGLQDIWQLHFSYDGAEAGNPPDSLIANLDQQCEGKYLKLTAESDGSFVIYNSRNKYTKQYPAKVR